MIELKSIEKSYGKLKVLKGIDLKVDTGEMVSIVGASGTGKTTLLQIMATLDRPDKGLMWYDKKEPFALKDAELARFRNLNIGIVFQFHHLLPEFTALENVFMPALIAGKNKNEFEERAAYLLEFLGLSDRVSHLPSELSGGEQQRVSVARALMNKPKVLLADEPSGNLDSSNAAEMHSLFTQLKEEFGQTIVIITHNNELAQMTDRCLRMKDGILTDDRL